MDFHDLKRKELQELCKKHGVPANLKNVEMANALESIFKETEREQIAVKAKSCFKFLDENPSDDPKKLAKKVRFSPHNETFVFHLENDRAARIKAREIKKGSVKMMDQEVAMQLSEGVENDVVKMTRSRAKKYMVADVAVDVSYPKGRRNVKRRENDVNDVVEMDVKVDVRAAGMECGKRSADETLADKCVKFETRKVSRRSVRNVTVGNSLVHLNNGKGDADVEFEAEGGTSIDPKAVVDEEREMVLKPTRTRKSSRKQGAITFVEPANERTSIAEKGAEMVENTEAPIEKDLIQVPTFRRSRRQTTLLKPNASINVGQVAIKDAGRNKRTKNSSKSISCEQTLVTIEVPRRSTCNSSKHVSVAVSSDTTENYQKNETRKRGRSESNIPEKVSVSKAVSVRKTLSESDNFNTHGKSTILDDPTNAIIDEELQDGIQTIVESIEKSHMLIETLQLCVEGTKESIHEEVTKESIHDVSFGEGISPSTTTTARASSIVEDIPASLHTISLDIEENEDVGQDLISSDLNISYTGTSFVKQIELIDTAAQMIVGSLRPEGSHGVLKEGENTFTARVEKLSPPINANENADCSVKELYGNVNEKPKDSQVLESSTIKGSNEVCKTEISYFSGNPDGNSILSQERGFSRAHNFEDSCVLKQTHSESFSDTAAVDGIGPEISLYRGLDCLLTPIQSSDRTVMDDLEVTASHTNPEPACRILHECYYESSRKEYQSIKDRFHLNEEKLQESLRKSILNETVEVYLSQTASKVHVGEKSVETANASISFDNVSSYQNQNDVTSQDNTLDLDSAKSNSSLGEKLNEMNTTAHGSRNLYDQAKDENKDEGCAIDFFKAELGVDGDVHNEDAHGSDIFEKKTSVEIIQTTSQCSKDIGTLKEDENSGTPFTNCEATAEGVLKEARIGAELANDGASFKVVSHDGSVSLNWEETIGEGNVSFENGTSLELNLNSSACIKTIDMSTEEESGGPNLLVSDYGDDFENIFLHGSSSSSNGGASDDSSGDVKEKSESGECNKSINQMMDTKNDSTQKHNKMMSIDLNVRESEESHALFSDELMPATIEVADRKENIKDVDGEFGHDKEVAVAAQLYASAVNAVIDGENLVEEVKTVEVHEDGKNEHAQAEEKMNVVESIFECNETTHLTTGLEIDTTHGTNEPRTISLADYNDTTVYEAEEGNSIVTNKIVPIPVEVCDRDETIKTQEVDDGGVTAVHDVLSLNNGVGADNHVDELKASEVNQSYNHDHPILGNGENAVEALSSCDASIDVNKPFKGDDDVTIEHKSQEDQKFDGNSIGEEIIEEARGLSEEGSVELAVSDYVVYDITMEPELEAGSIATSPVIHSSANDNGTVELQVESSLRLFSRKEINIFLEESEGNESKLLTPSKALNGDMEQKITEFNDIDCVSLDKPIFEQVQSLEENDAVIAPEDRMEQTIAVVVDNLYDNDAFVEPSFEQVDTLKENRSTKVKLGEHDFSDEPISEQVQSAEENDIVSATEGRSGDETRLGHAIFEQQSSCKENHTAAASEISLGCVASDELIAETERVDMDSKSSKHDAEKMEVAFSFSSKPLIASAVEVKKRNKSINQMMDTYNDSTQKHNKMMSIDLNVRESEESHALFSDELMPATIEVANGKENFKDVDGEFGHDKEVAVAAQLYASAVNAVIDGENLVEEVKAVEVHEDSKNDHIHEQAEEKIGVVESIFECNETTHLTTGLEIDTTHGTNEPRTISLADYNGTTVYEAEEGNSIVTNKIVTIPVEVCDREGTFRTQEVEVDNGEESVGGGVTAVHDVFSPNDGVGADNHIDESKASEAHQSYHYDHPILENGENAVEALSSCDASIDVNKPFKGDDDVTIEHKSQEDQKFDGNSIGEEIIEEARGLSEEGSVELAVSDYVVYDITMEPELEAGSIATSPVIHSTANDNGTAELQVESSLRLFSHKEINIFLEESEGNEAKLLTASKALKGDMEQKVTEFNDIDCVSLDEPIFGQVQSLKENDAVIAPEDRMEQTVAVVVDNSYDNDAFVEPSFEQVDTLKENSSTKVRLGEHDFSDELISEQVQSAEENDTVSATEGCSGDENRLGRAIFEQQSSFEENHTAAASEISLGCGASDELIAETGCMDMDFKSSKHDAGKMEVAFSFSSKPLIASAVGVKKSKWNPIQRTPAKEMLWTVDMKENTPMIKTEQPALVKQSTKRRALEDIQKI